ncbi:hypothetical protein Q7P35_002044 [Cladosporium inversicolor]
MMSRPSSSIPIRLDEQNSNKQWTCNECKHTFSQSKLLETHAVETDHKAYRCTKEKACGKVFILRSSWIRHERSHSAQKAHACSRCSKKFHRKDNCHDHERTCGRVARRARQSASTSPATSGTTRSVTPIDLLKAGVNPENLRPTVEPAHGGLWSLDTSDASHQKYNSHDDGVAIFPVVNEPGARPKSPPTSSAAYISPTQSRAAYLHDTTANRSPSPEHDPLAILNTTDNHTTSLNRTVTSRSQADSDWMHWPSIFQSQQDTVLTPDLQDAEDWDFVLVPHSTTAAPSASTYFSYDDYVWSGISATGHSRMHGGNFYPQQYKGYDSSYRHGDDITYCDARPSEFAVPIAPKFDIGGSATHIPICKPERRPRSKIATFFSKLKACIKAPFRRFKQ